jgi:hypothetical protein
MNRSMLLLYLASVLTVAGLPAHSQTLQNDPSTTNPPSGASVEQSTPDQVVSGTRILIGLQDELSTKEDKKGKQFRARTLQPITTASGAVIPAGAEVFGHIDKVEAAGKVGRARIWLTFDDIETRGGRKPLVAELIDAPGVHSVHVVYDHEGEIETPPSKRQKEEQAAAQGALAGASAGMNAKDKKDAAIGAAIGAANAFMAESGIGQELLLQAGTKLEIVLTRPLYLGGS